jgi:tetratricopeptide (TPR) repeat protein
MQQAKQESGIWRSISRMREIFSVCRGDIVCRPSRIDGRALNTGRRDYLWATQGVAPTIAWIGKLLSASKQQAKLIALLSIFTLSIAMQAMADDNEVDRLFVDSYKLINENRALEARQLLEHAAQLKPNSPSVHYNLGVAYEHTENIEKAILEFLHVLELKPHMARAMLNLGSCYQSLGNNKEAINWYQKFLADSPHSPYKLEVSDMIGLLRKNAATAGTKDDPTLANYLASVTGKGTYRWPKSKIPIKVFIEPGSHVPYFRNSYKRVLSEAFDAWTKGSGSKLAFKLVPDEDIADITCSWVSKPSAGKDPLSERGSAEIRATKGNIVSARITILTKPFLAGGVLDDDDVKKACLHEIGHALGLQGHSANNHDVMFLTVDTPTVWPVLSMRDKATISKLYANYPAKNQIPLLAPGTH